jgi:endonuclease/exonuclease/phosphatase family metal-dependent hydrolase/DNA-directed RNA polymerase subunit RPC12/RpoP
VRGKIGLDGWFRLNCESPPAPGGICGKLSRDVTFNCSHCGQSLEGEEAWAGQVIDCPACGKSLTVPSVTPPPARVAVQPKMYPRGEAPRRSVWGPTAGKFVLLLAVAAVGAFAYTGYRHGESPRQTWQRLMQPAQEPTPAASPLPELAAETPPPLVEPQPSPAAQPDALPWLAEHKEHWPKEVTLLRAADFPVVYDGRVAGTAQLPAGTVVGVVEITRDELAVVHRGGSRRIPADATDVRSRAAVAFARAEAAKNQVAAATPPPPEESPAEEPEQSVAAPAAPEPPPRTAFGSQETIRVTTWNLAWFPNGTPKDAPPAKQKKYIEDAADVLRQLDPDIILLQEIKDWDACTRLAEAIKPGAYHVAICSAFRQGREIGRQQVAVLAKQPAQAAWAEEWTSRSGVNPPRGYAFAWFKMRGADVGVYSLHLKSNRPSGRGRASRSEGDDNIRQREVATEQLVEHLGVIRSKAPSVRVVVVGGDLNTNPDDPRFAEEKTIPTLLNAGFTNAMELLSKSARVTLPSKGKFPATTFDYLFVRGATARPPVVTRSNVSDHFPVTGEFQLAAASRPTAAASGPATSAIPPNAPVWVHPAAGIYFHQGAALYGRTPGGRFMKESEAVENGYKPATAK